MRGHTTPTALDTGRIIQPIIQPRTDTGVIAQLVLLLVVLGVALWWARARPEWRLVVLGVGLLLLGAMGVRAAH